MRLAVAIIWLVLAATAHADDKTNARALFQQGIELYRAGKYEDAIAALAKSYELDAQFDTLYALAQAERLGGHCPDAIPHYNKILELTTDPTLAAAVQNNMGLCVTAKDREKEQACKPVVVAGSAPAGQRNKLVAALFAGSGVFAGAAIGMFVAASHSQAAAKSAPSYDEYERFTGRAGLERGLGFTFTAAAAIGVGGALYVVLRKGNESSPTVSAAVTDDTRTVFVRGRW